MSRVHAAAAPNTYGLPTPPVARRVLPSLPDAVDEAMLCAPRPAKALIRQTDLIQLKSHTHALGRKARLDAQVGLLRCAGSQRSPGC